MSRLQRRTLLVGAGAILPRWLSAATPGSNRRCSSHPFQAWPGTSGHSINATLLEAAEKAYPSIEQRVGVFTSLWDKLRPGTDYNAPDADTSKNISFPNNAKNGLHNPQANPLA